MRDTHSPHKRARLVRAWRVGPRAAASSRGLAVGVQRASRGGGGVEARPDPAVTPRPPELRAAFGDSAAGSSAAASAAFARDADASASSISWLRNLRIRRWHVSRPGHRGGGSLLCRASRLISSFGVTSGRAAAGRCGVHSSLELLSASPPPAAPSLLLLLQLPPLPPLLPQQPPLPPWRPLPPSQPLERSALFLLPMLPPPPRATPSLSERLSLLLLLPPRAATEPHARATLVTSRPRFCTAGWWR